MDDAGAATKWRQLIVSGRVRSGADLGGVIL